MQDLAYIECAGVRVPGNWTIGQLREALAKRKIRFEQMHEAEIIAVFGDAVGLKARLERQIDILKDEISKLDKRIKEKEKMIGCPGCGMKWTKPPASARARKAP